MAYDLAHVSDGKFAPQNRVTLTERFERRPALKAVLDTYTASVANTELVATNVANKDFSLLGTNAVTADLTYNAEGGLNLLTHGGASDSAIIVPQLSTNQSQWSAVTWGTDQETWWGCQFKTNTALTNTTIWAGLKLTNTPVVATDNDQVMFRYANGTDTNWQAVWSIGGTDTSTDSGVAVAVSTMYRMMIRIDSSRLARFYINDALVCTTTALTDATDLIPYVGVLSATDATAKKIVLYNEWISRNIA